MVRYLALDYEEEYGNDARSNASQYMLQRNFAPTSLGENCSNYRKPWTKVKKEDSSLLLGSVSFLCEPLQPPKLEKLKTECIFDHAVYIMGEEMRDPCPTIEFEEILASGTLKDKRPSIEKLLQKHSAVTLSDPYDEIQHKFSTKENLNFEFITVEEEINLTQLLSEDFNNPIEPDIGKFLIGNNFIQSKDLTTLNKIYPEEDPIVLDLKEEDGLEYCLSSMKKVLPNAKIAEKFTMNFESKKPEIMDCDSGYKESSVELLESPITLPLKKQPINFVKSVRDMVQLQIEDASQEEFIRYSNAHKDTAHEDCNPTCLTRLMIPGPKSLKCGLQQLTRGDIDLPDAMTLVGNLDDITPNENSQKSLSAEFTFLKTDLVMMESLTEIKTLSENSEYITFLCNENFSESFFTFSESVEKPLSNVRTTPQTSNAFHRAGGMIPEQELATRHYQNSLKGQPKSLSSELPVDLHSDLLQQLRHHKLDKVHLRKNSPLDGFIYQRKSINDPKYNHTKQQTNGKMTHKQANPQNLTPFGSPQEQQLPLTTSNYRLVKIKLTGDMKGVLRKLRTIIQPAVTILQKCEIIGNNLFFETLEEDVLKYHLRKVKKESQENSFSMSKQLIEVSTVVLYCFVVCRDKFITLSLQSACGFLSEFFTKKQQMLYSVGSINGNEEYSFIPPVIPDAIATLQMLDNKILQEHVTVEEANHGERFLHPKIMESLHILHERFTKDLRRGISPSSVLVILRNVCTYLLEELTNGISELNSNEFGGTLRIALLPSIEKQCDRETALQQALITRCNVIVTSMEYSIIHVDWSQFGLFLEYESYTDSPWKEISSKYNICHIAMETEKWDVQEDQHAIYESTPIQDVVIAASSKITDHPYLKQLLETRFNITVVGLQYKWSYRELHPIIGDHYSTVTPDFTISITTCIIVEECKQFFDQDVENAIDRVIFRAQELQCKFTKCYIAIAHLSQSTLRCPINGWYCDNLRKLQDAVEKLMKKSPGYQVVLFTDALDIDRLGSFINRLMSRMYADNALRENTPREFNRDECLLSQFPTINILVAHKLVASFSLKDIPSTSLLELTNCVPQVPIHFLEDFYKLIHTDDISTAGSQ